MIVVRKGSDMLFGRSMIEDNDSIERILTDQVNSLVAKFFYLGRISVSAMMIKKNIGLVLENSLVAMYRTLFVPMKKPCQYTDRVDHILAETEGFEPSIQV